MSPQEMTWFDEEDFKKWLIAVRKVRTSTMRIHVASLNVFRNFKELSNGEFESYLSSQLGELEDEKRRSKQNTLNTRLSTWNNLVKYFHYRGIATDLKTIPYYESSGSDIDPLDSKEIKAILSTTVEYGTYRGDVKVLCPELNLTYLLFTKFLATTGCRFNEAASIEIKDCNFIKGEIWLKKVKGRQTRKCYPSKPILDELKSLGANKNPDDLLFTNSFGGKLDRTSFCKDLNKRAKMVGIHRHINPHLLRHSFAADLKKNRTPLEDISDLLGHKDINTTKQMYIHLGDDDLRRASERNSINMETASPLDKIKMAREFIEDHFFNDMRFNQIKIQKAISLLQNSYK